MAHARRSAVVNVMIEAAEKAGRALIRDFGEVENLQVSKKGPGDFVSTADLKSEKIIRTLLQKARPKFGFLLEEGGEEKGEEAGTRWIADPLDGTTNFLHGIPHWSVTVALEKDKEIVAGVIYDPIRDEMFWAEKGLGAYMNSRQIRVSGRTSLRDSAIAAYPGHYERPEHLLKLAKNDGADIRTFGSCCLDLAYVAAGRMDGVLVDHLRPWDKAAGGLLVREAKGIATDIKGGKDFAHGQGIVAGNTAVHAEIMKTLKKAAA